MQGLSRTAPADPADAACSDPCCQRFDERKALISQGRERAQHQDALGGNGDALRAAANRFETYNSGIIRARASAAVYDNAGAVHCLDRLSTAEANTALGFPEGTLTDDNFRDDESGFKAEMFRSRSDGSLILAYRGTDPNKLVDWETNIENGLGRDTEQYRQARELAERIAESETPFDMTGHSKGGGIASMAAAVTPGVNATTFNSAGVSPSLVREVGGSTVGLNDRVSAFRYDEEFLTSMQAVTDPAEKIRRAEQLHSELEGTAGYRGWEKFNPLKIKHISPASQAERENMGWSDFSEKSTADSNFDTARTNFLNKFAREIRTAREASAKGDKLEGYFPPALGKPVDLGDAPQNTVYGRDLNARLNALKNHTMESVLTRMEETKQADQAILRGG